MNVVDDSEGNALYFQAKHGASRLDRLRETSALLTVSELKFSSALALGTQLYLPPSSNKVTKEIYAKRFKPPST